MTVLATFNCDALTGGTSRALDAIPTATPIDGYQVVDGCRAFVEIGGVLKPFVFDSSQTDATQTTVFPNIIRPLDYSSAGVWVEQFTGAPGVNILINGAPDVWQHGTSGFVAGDVAADMWQILGSGTTASQLIANAIPGKGRNAKTLRMTNASAAAGYLYQRISSEKSKKLVDKYVTASFWTSNYGDTSSGMEINMLYPTSGIADGWSSYTSVGSQTIWLDGSAPASGWAFCTATFGPLPESVKYGLGYRIGRVGSTSHDTLFAFLKLEPGKIYTPFEFIDPDAVLSECQRYYFKIDDVVVSNSDSVRLANNIIWPVTMRAAPTITVSNVSGGSGVAFGYATIHGCYQTIPNSSAARCTLEASAELF
ncbi:hypothetical protein DSCO28_50340 [Desulfosarcina ovata subsp. sediminis]|uniref:Tail fiber protein n=1 Tax=Desulfosarcina ovata subsp. sediminis TaxID=885957 RepID=A0A5K7ZW71_9BACT|nr:hypothetical protein [Desulfosarcina ovata]BBO80162.1 hypothetical protein DSCO28_07280 [Desulfosarcina ovata subsp. sediminis]BBO84468.1 hypothetical protein DSCO28_50340 [Desulfosarcina ovata subsp. sediminis]